MNTLSNIPFQIASTLILLLFSNGIHAQKEDRRPLSSPDLGWRITTESGSKSAIRVVCDYGDTFTKSGSHYTCCPESATTPCLLPTSCSGNTLLFADDTTKDCKNDICASLLIYESAPSQNPLGTQLVCRYGELGDSSPWTVYRNFPETTAFEPPPNHSSNKAWIAGGVVGAIAIAALVGFLGFCIARRRLRQKPASSKDEDTVPVNQPSVDDKDFMYKAHQAVELHSYDRAELHFDQSPVELNHYGSNVVEMPTQQDRVFVAELDGDPVRR
ncbi:hypothetical protein I7I51_05332 [Histoplasma capsulatum]|uniref:Uncharacterized protein n=1 Tax=Ajellomyces capsulatus TaxID=5037 RepID=A0A8A1M7T4_AJECA|nr:predicted protein [Histoplasma mississippiense (nom. inval.)]EDN03797.1 predicted protein [Histoplasma mississippiense (nom. inval.)]QSS60532.1 hypothetical protein I7I51_05332 [Histoplasma capsulatum]